MESIKRQYNAIKEIDYSELSREELVKHCTRYKVILTKIYQKLEAYSIALKYRTEEAEGIEDLKERVEYLEKKDFYNSPGPFD